MSPDPSSRPRLLGEAEYRDVFSRLQGVAKGGGYSGIAIRSSWTAGVRWARNQIAVSSEVCENYLAVTRSLEGGAHTVFGNDISDAGILNACRKAERIALTKPAQPQQDLISRQQPEALGATINLFDDATYNLDEETRSTIARNLIQSSMDAGMLSAGYVEVSARSIGTLDSVGQLRYYRYTMAQYTVTVRDKAGTGSGWAGIDANAWSRIDGAALSQTALDKCLKSRNPVAVEPGRYTVILEPQAVCDLVGALVLDPETASLATDRVFQEGLAGQPFNKSKGFSRIGEKVMDERITISADPTDPEMSFPPFPMFWYAPHAAWDVFPVYRSVTWIKNGILNDLNYDHNYGVASLHRTTSLANPGAFRMTGGTTSIEEMITTTQRGLLVTRFAQRQMVDDGSLLCRGYTRDGLWLVENGKISKPVKNMVFTESALFALNNVEQLGVPQRAYRVSPYFNDPMPAIVPPLKVRDFSFTSLADAV